MGTVVVTLSGDIDLTNADHVAQLLAAAIADGAHHLVVDVAGVTFIDSSGLRALARARVNLRGELTLRSPQPIVRRVLEVAGFVPAVTERAG